MRVQADTARIALRGALPPEPLEVNADRRALKQIVLNLVSNALKFTPTGGQVNVHRPARRAAMLELIVADTGVGIAAADLERLGRPYEQAGGADQRLDGHRARAVAGARLRRAARREMAIESRLGEGTAVTRAVAGAGSGGAPGRRPSRQSRRSSAPPPLAVAAGDNVIAFRPQR